MDMPTFLATLGGACVGIIGAHMLIAWLSR